MRELKTYFNKSDYASLHLTRNGKSIRKNVHRLVAEAFIHNPDNLPVVNHKDENPRNNNVDNLEWCTQRYNATYGTALERRATKTGRLIEVYSLDGQLLKTFSHTAAAAKALGVSKQMIRRVCKNGGRAGIYLMCVKGGIPTEKESQHYRPVVQMTLDNQVIKVYNKLRDAGKATNCIPSNIIKAIKGEISQTGGYHWKYADKLGGVKRNSDGDRYV